MRLKICLLILCLLTVELLFAQTDEMNTATESPELTLEFHSGFSTNVLITDNRFMTVEPGLSNQLTMTIHHLTEEMIAALKVSFSTPDIEVKSLDLIHIQSKDAMYGSDLSVIYMFDLHIADDILGGSYDIHLKFGDQTAVFDHAITVQQERTKLMDTLYLSRME